MTPVDRDGFIEAALARRALAVGAVCAALCVLGFFVNAEQALRSYLVAYTFWLGISLGSLAIWMLHNLTGGGWGAVLRDNLRAACGPLPLLALLFLPLAAGMRYLYPWMELAEAGESHSFQTTMYLNAPFFLMRAALYFGCWLLLAWLLDRWTAAMKHDPALILDGRIEGISGPGLIVYGLTVTFAAIDWIMSLEPHWSSTIFGALIATAQLLAALSWAIAGLAWLETRRSPRVAPDVWNDLGSLLLAFVMLWTYMSFSQLLLIWSGNLPEEIPWYLSRSQGGWQVVAVLLALFYFAFPFVFLLGRNNKRDPRRLGKLAAILVFMNLVHQFWIVAPVFSPGQIAFHWLDPVALAGVGGFWLAMFIKKWNLLLKEVPREGLTA